MLFRALPPFEFLEPSSVPEAVALLASPGQRAAVLAGGVSLVDDMKRGLSKPDAIVSLQKISDLRSLAGDERRGLTIGAMVTIRDAEFHPGLEEGYPALFEAMAAIHSVQVKSAGTVVGNLCTGTPASDLATALIALDALVTITGAGGTRSVPLKDFCEGPKKTCLKSGDIVTAVRVPPPTFGQLSAYVNLSRTKTDVSKIGAAVCLDVDGGVCTGARIAVAAVAPTVVRVESVERVLKGRALDEKVIREAADVAYADPAVRPISDLRSTAEYRREMVRVLVGRALDAARLRPAAAMQKGGRA
jgi:carbon-monoxide dehydrogenase medium subunit